MAVMVEQGKEEKNLNIKLRYKEISCMLKETSSEMKFYAGNCHERMFFK